MASGGADICVSSTSFQKKWHRLASAASDRKGAKTQYDISWFYPQKTFFQNVKIKLNSNAWMTLKSSVLIFQALKPLQPQWPQWPQQPQWPQWPRQPHFIKNFTDPDGLIIPSTQMTTTNPFLWNRSSKIKFFTNIWYSFCRRLLRPADVIFLKTGWWNTNPHLLKPLGTINQKNYWSFYPSELIYFALFNVRHPVVHSKPMKKSRVTP